MAGNSWEALESPGAAQNAHSTDGADMSTSVIVSPQQTSYPVFHPSPTVPAVAPASAVIAECGLYRARLASTMEDRLAAYRLRFIVFNLELQEGLESAYENGYDTDHFDDVCDHLIVEHAGTGAVVGTYRLQSGDTAARCFGYYSEQEFDFTPYESLRSQIVELGRACVHRDHRTSEVLNLLWKGIMRYSMARGGRYLMGCCSLTSQDVVEGTAVYKALTPYLSVPELITKATPAYAMPLIGETASDAEPPRLLRAYLTIGARICSEPAIDRDFKTIDFLTMLDLHTMNPRIARRYL
jgi:putative hemolysin